MTRICIIGHFFSITDHQIITVIESLKVKEFLSL